MSRRRKHFWQTRYWKGRHEWPPPGARKDGLCRGCLNENPPRRVLLRATFLGRALHFRYTHAHRRRVQYGYRPSAIAPLMVIPVTASLIYCMWALTK